MPSLTLQNDDFANLVILLARLFLSLPFLYSGIDKLGRWTAAQSEVAASGLPWPTLLHVVTVLVQILGGLSVLIGIEARLGALALCLFLIPVTVLYHPFWKRSGPDRIAEADHLLLNFAVIGGLLIVVVLGSGRFSLVDQSVLTLVEKVVAFVGATR
ncbi:MAG TPA: DoxX family protein [Xanthomonadaceae bacterium]|nr:DoxX family protein [Xanthomonadaceae bacterium]